MRGGALLGLAASLLVSVGLPGQVREQLASERPVLLVPGWSDTERGLAALRIRLVAAGWPEDHVAAVSFKEPTGSNTVHAVEIARAVEALVARTGAEEVDIVAHSMGGLATRKYLEDLGGAARVRRLVLLATPNRGTWAAYLAFGAGRDEMMPDSPFLDSLNAGPALPAGVQAITVRTLVDTRIFPPESATLPGVTDVELCCPTHDGLLRDLDTFRVIRLFLSEGVVEKGPR